MFGETVEKPRLMHEGLHHAHQLSDMILKNWPPVPTPMRWKYFTNDQILACVEFSQLLNDKSPTPMFTRLGETELRNTTSEEMISILGCFNRLFFPGATLSFEFEWLTDPGVYRQCLYSNTDNLRMVKIGLNRCEYKVLPDHPTLNRRAMARLSTLLHEVVHAYLCVYACTMCESSRISVMDARGHGRAWQHVAGLIEHAAPWVLGVPLKLGRFNAIVKNWYDMKYWPTREELTEWKLHDEEYRSSED
jgi:hypothetical protein